MWRKWQFCGVIWRWLARVKSGNIMSGFRKCCDCRESRLLFDLPKALTDKTQVCSWALVTKKLYAKGASWTGGILASACVHPLNDNSVVASNLMAGNRKLARKVTVLLKAISLVLWIPHFPTKNNLHDKTRPFSTRVISFRFFGSRFSWPFKGSIDSTPKNDCFCIRLILTGKAMYFRGRNAS